MVLLYGETDVWTGPVQITAARPAVDDWFERQRDLIPRACRFVYQSPSDFARVIADTVNTFSPDNSFLHFTRVTANSLEAIERELRRVQLRGCARFTYEDDMNALIVRLMPGGEHASTGGELIGKMRLKMSAIPGHTFDSVVMVANTRMVVRAKEQGRGRGHSAEYPREKPMAVGGHRSSFF